MNKKDKKFFKNLVKKSFEFDENTYLISVQEAPKILEILQSENHFREISPKELDQNIQESLKINELLEKIDLL